MNSRFLLFKASAGSGKTFNLAAQYIALLVAQDDVHQYRHTLAVTFTNKATAEMKDRILDFLYAIWKGLPKGEEPLWLVRKVLRDQYGLTLPEKDIRQRCGLALKAILHDYSHFYVSTIDAFFQSVLRSMAHELGLNARLQVDIDDHDVIELAVENLVDNLRHGNRDVLPWLRDYIEQQLEENKPWDVRQELKSMAQMLFREEYLKRSLDDRNHSFTIENIGQFKKVVGQERGICLNRLKQEAEVFEEALKRMGLDGDTVSYFDSITTYAQKLKEGILRSENNTDIFGKRLQGMVDNPLTLLKGKAKNDISLINLAEQLSANLKVLREAHKTADRRITSIDLVMANLTPMGLLGAIDAEVTRLTNERNRFMLARTPIMLKRMIGSDDASFVFERIGTQYNNIMIDEFQDTSQLQWANFCMLLLDNLATGGLSMIVGDIKQSIYRWRNGDWRILDRLDHHGHQGIPLTHNPLRDNYRSLGNIVKFNYRFFPIAARELDKLSPSDNDAPLTNLYAEEEVKQGIKKDPESGYVRISLCHTSDKDVEAKWQERMLNDLCRQVKFLKDQGVPYKKMVILLRKNRYIEPTITYFAEHMPEVQLVSNEAFLLGASVAVRMMVCALQMIDDIDRDPVAVRYVVRHYLSDVLDQPSTASEYYLNDYRQILPKDFIDRLDNLRNLPLYELCETIYRLLRLGNIAEQDAYFFTFLDELSLYLRDNPSDIPTFLKFWNDSMQKKPIPGSEVDGIRIYTIHKSKGLAFHTVLMPFAEWSIEKDHNDDLNWCMPTEAPLNEMGTVPIKFTKRVKDSIFATDYLAEHTFRRTDELNALYVAFTRAEANLYVWGISKGELKPDNFETTTADLLHTCLPSVPGIQSETEDDEGTFTTYTFGSHPAPAAQKEEKQGEISVKMQSYEGMFMFRQSNQAAEFVRQADEEKPDSPDEQQLSYIEQGKLLHYIFSKIESEDDINRVTEQFAKQGLLKSAKQLQQVRDLAFRGLRNEEVKKWFSGHYRLFNECNILVPDAETGKLQTRRPDRVMVTDDKIIVVDFKFGKPKEEYHEQVREYISILQAMHPQHQVEGWLWYVYKNRVEEVIKSKK